MPRMSTKGDRHFLSLLLTGLLAAGLALVLFFVLAPCALFYTLGREWMGISPTISRVTMNFLPRTGNGMCTKWASPASSLPPRNQKATQQQS